MPSIVLEPIVVEGKTLIPQESAGLRLGLKTTSLATAMSRGDLPLTRYYIGRKPWFDLAEIDQFIIKSAVPAGQRVR
jgi:hypothetical protein